MRRRGTELESAIRDAAMTLLAEGGHVAVTMEAVAAAAHTSKPVLYRRWPDRRALLRDVLLTDARAAVPTADTGSFRDDMLAVLRGWAELFCGPRSAGVVAAVAAMAQDSDLREAFRTDVIGWRKAEMAALLDRGIARGDVRADVPVEIARELGQSVLWHRLLITGDPIDDTLLLHLVDEVLVPFVAPRQRTRPPPTTACS